MKYRFLSHILASPLPTYGGQGSVMIEPVKSLQNGDSANVFRMTMENHWGTHVDAPYHFFDNGKKITDYPPVLLIEDMDLANDLKKLKEVWASPLRVERIDSAP